MKVFLMMVTLAMSVVLVAPMTYAEETQAEKKVEPKKKRVKYRKSSKHDFGAQNVDGKLRRPEVSFVTAGEGLSSNGMLRLREDFLDKFTSFCGEEIQ